MEPWNRLEAIAVTDLERYSTDTCEKIELCSKLSIQKDGMGSTNDARTFSARTFGYKVKWPCDDDAHVNGDAAYDGYVPFSNWQVDVFEPYHLSLHRTSKTAASNSTVTTLSMDELVKHDKIELNEWRYLNSYGTLHCALALRHHVALARKDLPQNDFVVIATEYERKRLDSWLLTLLRIS